jgi:hypothetical protein
MDRLEQEARTFTHYLVGRAVDAPATQLYKDAMQSSKSDATDTRLLNFMVAHPASIGFIDAGLVSQNASSEARRRLYVMLAILEASPTYYDLFLAQKQSPWYIFVIFYSFSRAVLKAGVGLVLVKVLS